MVVTHSCPKCNIPVAEERRKVGGVLRYAPLHGSRLIESDQQAPKVKCSQCGKTIILIKGSP